MGERFVVHIPTGPDLEFEGELLGEASHCHAGTMRIFRTTAGKLIAQHKIEPVYNSRQAGMERICVFETLDEAAGWLGYSATAKELFEKIGHPMRRSID
jgi:hypothetical protein